MFVDSCPLVCEKRIPRAHRGVMSSSTSCRNGRPLTDAEITGMLIGLLMAGQHTSSTTSAWLGFYLARDKELQVQASERSTRKRGT